MTLTLQKGHTSLNQILYPLSMIHVVKIRISRSCSSSLLIRKSFLPLCLLLPLWLSLSSFLSRSTRLSADVIVYLRAYGVREASAAVSKLPCLFPSVYQPLSLSQPPDYSAFLFLAEDVAS